MNDRKLKLLLLAGATLILIAVVNYFTLSDSTSPTTKANPVNENAGASSGSIDGKQMPPNHDKLIEAQNIRDHLKDNPNDTEHWTQLGNLLFDAGQFGEAIPAYKTSLEQQPNNHDVRTDYAVCLFNTGQLDQAIAELERVVQSNPNHATALFNLGVVSVHANRPQEARTYWNRVVEIDPSSEMAIKARESLANLTSN